MTLLRSLAINLHSGFRMACFRRCAIDSFRFTWDQFGLLVLLDLLTNVGSEYLKNLPDPEFGIYALPVYTFALACLLIAVGLLSRFWRGDETFLRAGVVIFSLAPVFNLLKISAEYFGFRYDEPGDGLGKWADQGVSFYVCVQLIRAFYLVWGRKIVAVLGAVFVVLASVPAERWFKDYRDFWYAAEDESEDDPYELYRALDAETLLYRQPALLDAALKALRPQRNRHVDLFYLGFAGFATEDVFSIEVDYIKQLLDRRFATQGHSLNLVNHLETIDATPIASATNLAHALKRIGRIMNRDEDILLLYLTSHGSRDHTLAVEFWPLPLNDITPDALKTMLDEAGIKWRVIVVSACYSGGFVDTLKGPHTLVASAAARDRASFGCGTESDFTYFGEAVFKEQLQRRASLPAAFKAAADSIARREKREKLQASQPQLWVGQLIETQLAKLEKSLPGTECRPDTPNPNAKSC